MFVRQIEDDTSVDRFLRVNEVRGVFNRRAAGFDYDLQPSTAQITFDFYIYPTIFPLPAELLQVIGRDNKLLKMVGACKTFDDQMIFR